MKTNISKLALIGLAAMFVSGVSNASYRIRLPISVELSEWVSADSIFGSWIDSGDTYDCGSYTPTPSLSLQSDYTQTGSCSQKQEQEVQEQEYDELTESYRVSNTYTNTQVVSVSDSRDVSVSSGSWTTTSSTQTCGSWSPATSTVRKGTSFTQSRTCTTPKEREWTHTADGEVIATLTESGTSSTTSTQTASGTRAYSWVYCSAEGGSCTFNSSQARYVRYGTAGKYSIKWMSSGVGCSNSNFGDPYVGQVKYCWYDQ